MNHMIRALTSIVRNQGKSVIYILIIILLGTTIATSIFVHHSVLSSTAHLQDRVPPVAVIEVNIDAMVESRNLTGELPSFHISPDKIRSFGALDMVRAYDFNTLATVYNSDLRVYESNTSQHTKTLGSTNLWMLRGVNHPGLIDIEEGLIELVNGRTFTYEEVRILSHVAVVSEQFAYNNQLTLGSIVSMRNDVPGMDEKTASEWYDIEIIGIFRPIVSNQTARMLAELQNRIYVSNSLVEYINRFSWLHSDFYDISQDYYDHMFFSNFFTFYDMEGIQEFRRATRAMGLPSHFEVVDAGNSLAVISDNLKVLEQISNSVLIFTIVLSIGILALLMILFLKNRQHEIAIYRSLGEKPLRLMGQALTEILVIACFGLSISLVAGILLSNQISQHMILAELQALHQSEGIGQFMNLDTLARMGYQVTISTDSVFAALQEGFGLNMIFWFFGVGLSTVFLSTIAPLIYLLRMNPKKIMM